MRHTPATQRLRTAALLPLLLLALTAFRTAHGQNVIYDEALGTDWWETLWNCAKGGKPAYNLSQSATVASGTKAIEVTGGTCNGGWGALGFDHRKQNWSTIHYMTPTQGDVLTFKYNPGPATADDAHLGITLNVSGGINRKIADYLPSNVQPGTWYTVTIPLLDLMKTPTKFYRVFFWNMNGATAPHFFLDDVALGKAGTPVPPPVPPALSGVQVESFSHHATLSWTTDKPATSRIEYGTGGYNLAVEDAVLKTAHRLSIPDLAPETAYQFRLAGTDAGGRIGRYEQTPPASFTTQADPEGARRTVIYDDARGADWWETRWECGPGQPAYNLAYTGTVASGQKAIEVRHGCAGGWGAFGLDHRKADWTQHYYMYPGPGDVLTFKYNPGASATDDAGLHVTLDLHDLNANQPITRYLPSPVRPNTWYTVTIPLLDLMKTPTKFFRVYFFNQSNAQPHYYLDDLALEWGSAEVPPVFSDVAVTHVGPDSARVAWSTDKQSRYTFRYQKNGQTVEQAFADYASSGSIILRGLAPSTAYPFEIEAVPFGADASAAGYHTGTLTTTGPDVTPPAFSNVQVEVHVTHAILTWTTDEATDARVEYGAVGGPAGYPGAVAEPARGTSHRVVVTGLVPATTYRYRLGGTDVYGNTGWHEPVPAATFTTLAAPTTTLTVDAGIAVRPFRDAIRGQALANWAVYYNRPYPNDSAKLLELTRLIKPGLLRYAGGLWSNNMMWSRQNTQGYPSGMMDTNDDGTPDKWSMRSHLSPAVAGVDRCGASPTAVPGAYKYALQAEEMDRLAAFAQYVDADVMIEVDVTTCDPEMWADLVRYVNVEKGYGFKYWELGNELDLDYMNGYPDIPVGPAYVSRFKRYHDALKAVDPAIRIAGPTTASHALDDNHFQPYERYIDPLTADAEVRSRSMLGSFTFHYYPLWKNASWGIHPTYRDMLNYSHAIPRRGRDYVPTMLGGMRQVLDSRGFRDVPIAITEFNAIAADNYTPLTYNHANALFMADMLGRLAYHGADEIAHWLLFDKASETSYGILDHNESSIMRDWNGSVSIQDKFTPMPVYYAFLMYGQLFGDQLVRTTSAAEDRLSIWASTDTDEPGALKLMVTNTSDEAIQATVQLNGVAIQSARYYLMENPAWVAATDKDAVKGGTTINGLAIDATSAQAILASARAILSSGRPLGASGSTFTFTFPPYSAMSILVNAGDVVVADMPALQAPVFVAPMPGATPELRWQAAPRAHTYRVQVSANASFTTTILDRSNVTEAGIRVQGLSAGTTYYARVQSAVLGEKSGWSAVQAFTTAGAVSAPVVAATVADEPAKAEDVVRVEGEVAMAPAYPNPFNPTTTFGLTLAREQRLTVEVYNVMGQRVATLYDGHAPALTPLTFTFDASYLPSGLYLYQARGETFREVQRVTLVK